MVNELNRTKLNTQAQMPTARRCWQVGFVFLDKVSPVSTFPKFQGSWISVLGNPETLKRC
jgi:hypothetical protein